MIAKAEVSHTGTSKQLKPVNNAKLFVLLKRHLMLILRLYGPEGSTKKERIQLL
jgi:hypothetical protein